MKAIILAAGRGSRMGHMSADQPKCLTKLAGYTLLEWQVATLREAGIEEIGIVRGYHKELLPDSLHHFDNERWQETNMVASLRCASEWLSSSPCIVSYADIVYVPQTIRMLVAAQDDLVISYNTQWLSLWHARLDDPLADAETFVVEPDGRVSDIGRRPQSLDEVKGQYMGLLKFEPAAWMKIDAYLETLTPAEVDRLDMTSLLQRLITNGLRVQGVPIPGMWYEIDTERDWALCEQEIADQGDQHWLTTMLNSKPSIAQ